MIQPGSDPLLETPQLYKKKKKKKLAQRLIFSADCSQSMGLTSVLKVRRFENVFLFCLFKDHVSDCQ
jgi:hypothetical protein